MCKNCFNLKQFKLSKIPKNRIKKNVVILALRHMHEIGMKNHDNFYISSHIKNVAFTINHYSSMSGI